MKSGIDYGTVRQRILRNWTLDKALTTPLANRQGRRYAFEGEDLKLHEISARYGISYSLLYYYAEVKKVELTQRFINKIREKPRKIKT